MLADFNMSGLITQQNLSRVKIILMVLKIFGVKPKDIEEI